MESDAPDLADVQRRLQRALVARFGLDVGMDAAADACEHLVRNRSRVEAMANPVGYLYRVGERLGRRRSERMRRTDVLVQHPATADRIVDVDLQRALRQLPPAQRVAVVLTAAHGHSYREVADLLDVPATTVTNHVTRGRARLRTLLEER